MSIYLIWFLIGISFLIAEFLMPTFIMFFFAIGAIIVSVITACYDLSINLQIILFALFSVTSLVLLRNYMKNIFYGSQNQGNDQYNHQNVNDASAIITKAIPKEGFGEIKFKGTFYKAKSEDPNIEIKIGENVTVVKKGNDTGSFYIIKK